MNLVLAAEDAIRLEGGPGVLELETGGLALSPFHLLAASLATCTYSVLYAWALNSGLSLGGLAIAVRWAMVQEPSRVDDIVMEIEWPALPSSRREAARRAAAACAIHNTLAHGTRLDTVVVPGPRSSE